LKISVPLTGSLMWG